MAEYPGGLDSILSFAVGFLFKPRQIMQRQICEVSGCLIPKCLLISSVIRVMVPFCLNFFTCEREIIEGLFTHCGWSICFKQRILLSVPQYSSKRNWVLIT